MSMSNAAWFFFFVGGNPIANGEVLDDNFETVSGVTDSTRIAAGAVNDADFEIIGDTVEVERIGDGVVTDSLTEVVTSEVFPNYLAEGAANDDMTEVVQGTGALDIGLAGDYVHHRLVVPIPAGAQYGRVFIRASSDFAGEVQLDTISVGDS